MNWQTDLPGEIEVRVNENRFGHVTITPTDPTICLLVGQSNEYNGSYEVYLQNDADIIQFLQDFPKARYAVNKVYSVCKIGQRYYAVNDGAKFTIDSWEFRHMVGGQSD